MKVSFLIRWLLLLLSCHQLALPNSCNASQTDNLHKLIKSWKFPNHPRTNLWDGLNEDDGNLSPVYIGPQDGLMQANKINALPGQPKGVDFDQYAGYVTVDPKAGRALFYYLVESPHNSSSKPLVLWLNGGPKCSSFGYGAMEELGPFRVRRDGKTLFRNDYAWNNVANVIFLESPAGVGFSYSNTSFDYANAGDTSTAEDSYTFLVNWLERFPQYKNRDFFITGESYAGHYVPQLAYNILKKNNKNKNTTQTIINLKGIAIGNAWIDDITATKGTVDFLWTHAMNSDETNAGINKHCDLATGNYSSTTCGHYLDQLFQDMGKLDIYSIYAPLCNLSAPSSGSVKDFDPCSVHYVNTYLNLAEVQTALHVKATNWTVCNYDIKWTDRPTTVLPIIKQLISGANAISVWIYSGDTDAQVSVTGTKYAINALNLTIDTAWRPWYSSKKVGGYVVGYKGLTFATVRGAGHMVPSYQPERALTMISSFLQGKLPPSS